MALTKHKIGELVSVVDERNSYGITSFFGINKDKVFMPTVADTTNLDASKYKVVRYGRYVYSGMQTGRDKCIRVGMYEGKEPIIVSPAYLTFEITATDVILPEYFFMIFLSPERDRMGWFYSDGSVRSNLDWPVFCDIALELPDIPTQQKFVDVYKAMVANQKCYENGLSDLKLTCDANIENLRREMPCEKIGPYIQQSDRRNDIGLTQDDVRGISIEKKFIFTKADMTGVNVANYKVVEPDAISFVTVTSRNGEKITIALNNSDDFYLVSGTYEVFTVMDKTKLLPAYLAMFFNRAEFDRYSRFHSWGSARETFNWDDMQNVKIPIPDIHVQQAIVNIYKCYLKRKEINERLKAQIKDLCPILIRGSLQEGGKTP